MREWDTLLQAGDIVVVHNALMQPKEYPVLRIKGNKAITGFRVFNRRIYHGNVYEYGKPFHSAWYKNIYEVKVKGASHG